jgi:hypothetical protein
MSCELTIDEQKICKQAIDDQTRTAPPPTSFSPHPLPVLSETEGLTGYRSRLPRFLPFPLPRSLLRAHGPRFTIHCSPFPLAAFLSTNHYPLITAFNPPPHALSTPPPHALL